MVVRFITCRNCNGSGLVKDEERDVWLPCPECEGRGGRDLEDGEPSPPELQT